MKIKRSTYYYHVSHNCEAKDGTLIELIKTIFAEHQGRYGYRRITLALQRLGHLVNHKKIKRLMSELNLLGRKMKVKYKSYRGEISPICKNILLAEKARDFSTTACNQKWTTDVSEFKIQAGKLYLSPILDMHNGEIVAFDVSTSPNKKQTQRMLAQAFAKYPNLHGLILHSDQGWQYQMADYKQQLKERGIVQSMSRKGNCLDNAMMESFFGVMKREMFYGFEKQFKSLSELKNAIINYIAYYNTQRIKVKLKGLTPVEHRLKSQCLIF